MITRTLSESKSADHSVYLFTMIYDDRVCKLSLINNGCHGDISNQVQN